MEATRHLNTEYSKFQDPLSIYLKRPGCPSCYTSTNAAKLEVQSQPSAEKLPLDQQGQFLSGYTNHRVFFSYYRCPTCQLLYCPTYFTQDQLDNLYNSQSENMAEAPLSARDQTQKAYFKLLKQYPVPQGDYLEIGPDIGLFAKFFTNNDQINQLFLYEPNGEVHETLKKNVHQKKYSILTKNYSFSDLATNQLSIAVIIHALDHVLNPRQLLQELYQNLKPGGIIFIVTHDESSLLAKLLKKKWPPYTLQHPQLFSPATIQNILRVEGFQVLTTTKTANYFPLTHFIKGGLTALGLNKIPLPDFKRFIIPIKLGNIATIAQKPMESL